jgi:iron complex transport system ATP-binding protein
MIRLEDVSFGYGERTILSALSLEIPAGQFLGVIGPNGAGKSTLIHLLLDLVRPTNGRILIDGRAPKEYDRRRFAQKVAAVTQEEGLDFPFSALEVVLMGRTARLSPFGFESQEDLEIAHGAMVQTGVAHLAARPLHALSGGERKRVLLARALAQSPEILILDEPAAALDIHHQIAIFDLLRDLHARGVTVVVVVHDLNLAAAYCERLVLLQSDAPARCGSVEEILTYARVRDTFGVEVYVGVNEVSGTRFLVPMSSRKRSPEG